MFDTKLLKLGIKDKNNLRYDLDTLKNNSVEETILFVNSRFNNHCDVICLYNDYTYLKNIGHIYKDNTNNGIYKRGEGFLDLEVTKVWFEFEPDNTNYSLYLLTKENNFYEKTFFEELCELIEENFLEFTMSAFLVVCAIIAIGLLGIIFIAIFLVLLTGIYFITKKVKEEAKLNRFIKIYEYSQKRKV